MWQFAFYTLTSLKLYGGFFDLKYLPYILIIPQCLVKEKYFLLQFDKNIKCYIKEKNL